MNPIVQLSPTYFSPESVIGGGERYVHELSRFLAKQSNDPVVLVSFGEDRISRMEDGYRLEVFPALTSRGGFTRDNPLSFGFLPLLWNAKVIHVHQISTMVGDFACLLGWFRKKKVFVTDHGGGGGRLLQTRLPIMKGYTMAIAQSKYAKERLANRKGLKVVEIPGGVDLERFKPRAKGKEERKTILFVGRLVPLKGADILIEAFRKVGDLGAQLVIVGKVYDYAYEQRLHHLAEGLDIRFIHNADDAMVQQLMTDSCVTVLPSLKSKHTGELMGFVPLESMACGTPVIVSDEGALKEFVSEGVSGWISKSGNVEDLADCIRRIWNRDREMGLKARQWVEQFSWQEVANHHLDLYYKR